MQDLSLFFSDVLKTLQVSTIYKNPFQAALKWLSDYFYETVAWDAIRNLEIMSVDNYAAYQGDVKLMLVPIPPATITSRCQTVMPILFSVKNSANYYILVKHQFRYRLVAAKHDGNKYLPLATLTSLSIDKAWLCSPIGLEIPCNFTSLLKKVWVFTKNDFFVNLLLGGLVAVFSLLTPLVSSYVMSHIHSIQLPGQSVIFVSISFIFVAMTGLFALNELRLKNYNLKVLLYIMPSVWYHLLSLPFKTIQRYQSGDVTQKVFDYELAVSKLMSVFMQFIFGITAWLIVFCYMVYCQMILTLIFTVACIFMLCIKLYLAPKSINLTKQQFAAQSQLTQFTHEMLLQIHKVRSSGTENIIFKRWLDYLLKIKVFAEKSMHIDLFSVLIESSVPIFLMSFLYLTVYLLPEQPDTFKLLQFIISAGQFTMIFDKLSMQMVNFIHLMPNLMRLRELAVESTEEQHHAKALVHPIKGSIAFKQVSLHKSDSNHAILQDISLDVPTGKFIAIVGTSGAGKSSLFKLLLGLESVDSGMIYVDGLLLSAYNISELRQQFGVVMQTSNLLPGTIFSNLSAQTDLTHDEAWHLAYLTGLDKDIEAMPMKMHTFISDNAGESLSGGQKQKIMIARALASKPKILLLDEATSALDNASQSLIFNNLKTLQITRVVIAHRNSTIADADYIYVLDKGRVVEEGTYNELLLRGCFQRAIDKKSPFLQ